MSTTMRRMRPTGMAVITLSAFILSLEVFAWEPTGEIVPRPAADVEDPAVTAVYEALRNAPEVERPNRRAEVRPETKSVTVERLEEVIDGSVLVSRPVEQGQEAAMLAMGVRAAANKEEVGHHTLFEGRYFHLLTLIPTGPDEITVRAHLGEEMRIETALRTDRRALLVDFRRL